MKELKVVIDSNILVSILKGKPNLSLIYTFFKEGKFKLVVSAEILKELAAVLYRPHLKINPSDIKELFRLIKEKAIRVTLSHPFINVCRDPKDNFILELAVKSGADCIVTGDEDLLVLSPFEGLPIITLKEFLSRLRRY